MISHSEFRSDPELVKSLRELIEDHPTMKLALEIMESEHPKRYDPTPDVTPHYAHIQLGQQTGYQTFGSRLRLLATRIDIPAATPEAKYEDEPPPAEE